MKIDKINENIVTDLDLPVIEKYAVSKPVWDRKSEAIRNDWQLQKMLGHETIHEIRKVAKNHYLVMTSGGHEIPVEVRGVPYGRGGPHFLRLDWNGGLFAMYLDMDIE